MNEIVITDQEIDETFEQLDSDAKDGSYNLNPVREFTDELIRGLLTNNKRYGYMACPCRLASGDKEEDLDIICPCDYRDPDLDEFDMCYCALYVSKAVIEGEKQTEGIPERRPPRIERMKKKQVNSLLKLSSLPLPVWRCKVCGYLAARENPPGVCPICKAKRDRFEKFI